MAMTMRPSLLEVTRITPDSKELRYTNSPGLQQLHRYMQGQGQRLGIEFSFFEEMFYYGGLNIIVGNKEFPTRDYLYQTRLRQEQTLNDFRTLLKRELDISDVVLQKIENDSSGSLLLLRTIAKLNLSSEQYRVASAITKKDYGSYKFSKEINSNGEVCIYLDVVEKLRIEKKADNDIGNVEYIIPGHSVTRYQCTQPNGGFKWLHTDVSNDTFKYIFLAEQFPKITPALLDGWKHQTDRFSRFLITLTGMAYGFAAGFVKSIKMFSLACLPVLVIAAFVAIPFPLIALALVISSLMLIISGAVLGGLVGAIDGGVAAHAQSLPRNLTPSAIIKTYAKYPSATDKRCIADLQQQQAEAEKLPSFVSPTIPAKGTVAALPTPLNSTKKVDFSPKKSPLQTVTLYDTVRRCEQQQNQQQLDEKVVSPSSDRQGTLQC